MPTLSIVICTFRRPDLLVPCLASCLAQEDLSPGALEIVVVDNCPDRSAHATVDGMAGPVRYVSEPRTNVSHARNTGVEAARAPLLAFVDDDNRLPPHWARTVLDAMAARGADCLFGDVEPAFPSEVPRPAADLVRPYFRRHVPGAADGTVTPAASGHIHGARTCNVVLRMATCFPADAAPWFDPAFGLSGGEDTDFFMRLGARLRDGRILTSADAVMDEFIPADRVNPDYVVRRTYWGGQVFSLASIRNSRHRGMTRAAVYAKAMVQIAALGLGRAAYGLTGRPAPLGIRTRVAAARGKLNDRALLRKTGPYR